MSKWGHSLRSQGIWEYWLSSVIAILHSTKADWLITPTPRTNTQLFFLPPVHEQFHTRFIHKRVITEWENDPIEALNTTRKQRKRKNHTANQVSILDSILKQIEWVRPIAFSCTPLWTWCTPAMCLSWKCASFRCFKPRRFWSRRISYLRTSTERFPRTRTSATCCLILRVRFPFIDDYA